jgi:hypothetical protein
VLNAASITASTMCRAGSRILDGLLRRRVAGRARCTAEPTTQETKMDNEAFNQSIRKFLRTVGVKSQQEIEQAVAKASASGAIAGTETFPATMTLRVAGLQLEVEFDGEIRLQ